MNLNYKRAAGFGFAHGINDFIGGYLLSYLAGHGQNKYVIFYAFLIYSLIAFGGQLPVGIVLDKVQKLKSFSLFGVAAMAGAIILAPFHLLAAIILSGIASAFVHVCGGTVCYLSKQDDATLMGMFASPGVIGLVLGTVLGAISQTILVSLRMLLPLAALFIWMQRISFPSYEIVKKESTKTDQLISEQHDFFMIVLLAAIAFRSLLWNMVQLIHLQDYYWILGLGISAGIGKLAGGYLSFKINWKNYILISMFAAILFLNIDRGNFWLFCIGVALLQSALPVTVLLMQNFFKTLPATAAGLSLGVAVILAGLPTYLESVRRIPDDKWLFLGMGALFLLFNGMVVFLGKRKVKVKSEAV
ncbi:MAG: hypothetical protein WBJ84_05835 [Bacteroidales bacterium]